VALSQGQEAEGNGLADVLEDDDGKEDDDECGIMLSAPSSPDPSAPPDPPRPPHPTEDKHQLKVEGEEG